MTRMPEVDRRHVLPPGSVSWYRTDRPLSPTESPFHQWTGADLINEAFKQPLPCAPETCFHYAHTNLPLLSEVISEARLIDHGG
jgi:hypothetical protein